MSTYRKIEALIKERGISRYKLSKDTGVPYSTLTQILNGRTKDPQISALQAIADYFDKSLDYILNNSIAAVVEDRLSELGLTMEELADKSKIPLSSIENLDNISPGPWDYEPDGIVARLAAALDMDVNTLGAAFSRLEAPDYEGQPMTPEEAFGTPRNEDKFTEEEILTMAAHQIGHEGELTEEEMKKIKLAMKIALNKENN